MTNDNKIMTVHLQRFAYIYIRQSTTAQVEHNRESTIDSTNFSSVPMASDGLRTR